MKKFLIILLVLLISSGSYGADSEKSEVYVRQDVFDAKMDALRTEMQAGFQMINTKFDALEKKMDAKFEAVDKKFEAVNAKFEAIDKRLADIDRRIDNNENHSFNRHEDLKTIIYWGFSVLGLLIGFAIFAPSFAEFLRNLRKPSLTLEDIERLIDAKLSSRLQ